MLRTRQQGIISYTKTSATGILHCLLARKYFYTHYISDISFFLSNGACLVNLWHGPPMKKIEFDNRLGPSSKRYTSPTLYLKYIEFPWVYKRPYYIVSTSSHVACYSLMSAFRLKQANCLNLGEPRLDAWTCNDDRPVNRRASWQKFLAMEIRGMKILYMPTWRDSGKSLNEFGVEKLEVIESFCHETGSHFFIKPHLWTHFQNSGEARLFERLHIIEGGAEMYYAMRQIDCLVSDYSSIMLEWTVTNKPLVCFSTGEKNY
jgi:CDP-glycerol glycerophosphotransferase (TagB/SpsB family)